MERRLIVRGLLAGVIGGLLSFIFARIFAEPQIQAAIDYESARDDAQATVDKAAGLAGSAPYAELFSRTIQANVGIGVGMIAFGAAMGALFAVAYSICLGRVGNLRPRSIAILVAVAGFAGLFFVPFLKYPANPPSIGHSDTISQRSGLYLIMVVCSLAFLFIAVRAGQRLAPRFGNWNATLLAAGGFVVAIGIVMVILPSLGHLAYNRTHYGDFATETPQPMTDANGTIVFPGFPADTLFLFRLYSVIAQAILWTAIGLVFAPMADRLLRPEMARARPAPEVVPA
jgi:predicted cobalt transporter CbtA